MSEKNKRGFWGKASVRPSPAWRGWQGEALTGVEGTPESANQGPMNAKCQSPHRRGGHWPPANLPGWSVWSKSPRRQIFRAPNERSYGRRQDFTIQPGLFAVVLVPLHTRRRGGTLSKQERAGEIRLTFSRKPDIINEIK